MYTGIAASLASRVGDADGRGKTVIDLGGWNYRWHDLIIGAVAHVVLFVVGYAASLVFHRDADEVTGITIWKWLQRHSVTVK